MTEPSSIQANAADATPKVAFFPVSPLKLLIMDVLTFSAYQFYWFFRNWRAFKRYAGWQTTSPFWRSFFAFFYCYSLFDLVRTQARTTHVGTFPAGWATTAWIALTLCGRLPDPYWVVSFLSVLPLLSVQVIINRINTAILPSHDRNARFSWRDLGGIVLVWTCLILAGFAWAALSDPPEYDVPATWTEE